VQIFAVFVTQGSNLARSINTMLREAESLPELAGIVDEWRSSFDPIHAATAFYMAGSLAQGKRAATAGATPLLDQLAGIWVALLPSAGAQALSNVLWACSKLRYTNPTLWSSTVATFVQLLQESDDFTDQSVSNVMYSLATIASVNKAVVPGLSKAELEETATALCKSLPPTRQQMP
jgi:predicted permease